jgi:hypothetical protein
VRPLFDRCVDCSKTSVAALDPESLRLACASAIARARHAERIAAAAAYAL